MKYGRVLSKRPRDGQWIRGPTIPLNCAKAWAQHTTDNIIQRFEEVTDLTTDDYDTTTAYLNVVHSGIESLKQINSSDFNELKQVSINVINSNMGDCIITNTHFNQNDSDTGMIEYNKISHLPNTYTEFISNLNNELHVIELMKSINSLNLKLCQ
tara:strand:+ start:1032 stop:1496 length:465 start_codon:yes stop_codon:yes gene_type:complete